MKFQYLTVVIGISALLVVPDVLTAGGAVSGKIVYDGKVPGRRKIQMAADPLCAAKHTATVRSEAMIVNADTTLKNVFVYVKKGLEGKKFETPTEPVVLDQNGCIYKPHVLGVQVGQPLKILNNDGTLHNIHPKPKVNKEFNLAMPKFMKKKVRTFEKAEVMIPVKCDVHPWMQSFIGVLDHPHYGVSGDDGSFTLNGLDAGTYTIEAWHEICGSQTQEVSVKDGEDTAVEFTFKLPARKKKK